MKIVIEVDTHLIDTAMQASGRASREATIKYALQRFIGIDPEAGAHAARRNIEWTGHLTVRDLRSRFPRAG
jgi:hypothetical protein